MTTPPEHAEQTGHSIFIDTDAEIWRKFVSPQNNEEFYQTWLALLCRQLSDIKAGLVLLRSEQANTFAPVAVWPEVTRDLSHLSPIAERALSEARGVADRADDSTDAPIHVAYPIEISKQMHGAVVLEATSRSDAEIKNLLRQLHWGIAWLYELIHRNELAINSVKVERIGTVMEVTSIALSKNKLQQVLFDLTNQLARYLDCSRVAIGLIESGSVKLTALSNAAWFEKKTNIVKLYGAAMEETYDQLAPFSYTAPAKNSQQPTESKTTNAHARLAQESGAHVIYSLPLLFSAQCVGILMLERDQDSPFTSEDYAWLDALSSLLPAVIDQKIKAERGLFARARDDLRSLGTKIFGPGHLIWKFSLSLVLMIIFVLTFVKIDYRVSARTIIEGQVQRAAVAPFEGFVASSNVRPGDIVKQGQVLVTLDDNDLLLDKHKWNSELQQSTRKLRDAMAQHDLATFQVLSAQVQQAKAQLSLAEERLQRANITAPFDGVVISGDLSQLIGSPVEQGKKLFEIAPLESYRVILQVDEREIRNIQFGQHGRLVMSGLDEEPIPFKVIKVTPIATARDGQNFFRVEALVEKSQSLLRPGMEGIGKITVGERRLWWILTHSFTDWLRLSLWKWMP